MSFSKEAFTQSSPPHIHSGDSVSARNWLRAAALLPVLVAAFVLGSPGFLRTAFLGSAAVVGFDWLVSGFFRRRSGIADGDAALTGLLYILLLPSDCSSGVVMFGAFMVAVIAGGFFGGRGSRLFHSAAFGRGAIELVFPGSLSNAVVLQSAGDPWMTGALALSVFVLIAQRQVYWEAWFYATSVIGAGAFLFGHSLPGAFSAASFALVFLLSDPSTLPLTRRGTNLFATGAALLAVLFGNGLPGAVALAYGTLILNCISPWLEVWFSPKAYQFLRSGNGDSLHPTPPIVKGWGKPAPAGSRKGAAR